MEKLFEKEKCCPENPKWEQAIKRENSLYNRNNSIRSEFERDYTRLLHSQAFSRLKHKTQVFYSPHNDHICTRMEHVLHVASVSTTIAKSLGLNEQLTQAAAIGHDIGHAPFGHHGEDCLNRLLEQKQGANAPKKFWHERNSLFFADYIETLYDPDGVARPLDLTYAVRDGLICHCGEIDQQGIKPRDEAIDLYSIKRPGIVQPFTWEACVVKVSDKIAFLGRDIQDAFTYGIINNMTAYRQMREIVGSTLGIPAKGTQSMRSGRAVNPSVLINDLIVDLCNSSSPEKGLCFSENYFKFLQEIKKFNFNFIYNHWRLQEFAIYAENIIQTIFRLLMKTHAYVKTGKVYIALKRYPNLRESFEEWLIKYTVYQPYNKATGKFENIKKGKKWNTPVVFDITDEESYKKCVIEYISGMTDHYAIKVYEEIITF